jgi:hypothetical protein
LAYVFHLVFNAILGDVEVFELCPWVLMNGFSSSWCDGYKGGRLGFILELRMACFISCNCLLDDTYMQYFTLGDTS